MQQSNSAYLDVHRVGFEREKPLLLDKIKQFVNRFLLLCSQTSFLEKATPYAQTWPNHYHSFINDDTMQASSIVTHSHIAQDQDMRSLYGTMLIIAVVLLEQLEHSTVYSTVEQMRLYDYYPGYADNVSNWVQIQYLIL
ncbi:hypothetical protein Tco_0038711 [Tanacetum coccineum]